MLKLLGLLAVVGLLIAGVMWVMENIQFKPKNNRDQDNTEDEK